MNTDNSTPKSKKRRSLPNPSSSDLLCSAVKITDEVFQQFMNDPVKKKLIMDIVTSEKDSINAYKRSLEERNLLHLISTPEKTYESPTALYRRRALEQLRIEKLQKNESESHDSGSTSNQLMEPLVHSVDLTKPLEGVKVYLDVNKGSKNYLEAILVNMGAVVKEKFTEEVTHVIFKDGSTSTYEKAKLLNVHLLSVLWVYACKSNKMKVPEEQYPAFTLQAHFSPHAKNYIQRRRASTGSNSSDVAKITKSKKDKCVVSSPFSLPDINEETPKKLPTVDDEEMKQKEDIIRLIAEKPSSESMRVKIISPKSRETDNHTTPNFFHGDSSTTREMSPKKLTFTPSKKITDNVSNDIFNLKRRRSSTDLDANVDVVTLDSKQKKKFRKLYNPNNYQNISSDLDDEKEREDYRRAAKRRRSSISVYLQ